MRIHVNLLLSFVLPPKPSPKVLSCGGNWVSNQMERFRLTFRARLYRRPVNATAFYPQRFQQKIVGRPEIMSSALVNKISNHLTLSMFRNTFR